MRDRGHLLTEQRNAASTSIDRVGVERAIELINDQDATVVDAVREARGQIASAVQLVVAALRQGGRLIYVGAGTSGRLGVIDAAECPPTFLSDPEKVQAIIAGGPAAMFASQEAVEDDATAASAAIDQKRVCETDVVMGIAAGGTTPYVHAALRQARQRGAKTVFFTCVAAKHAAPAVDVTIRVLTGPEIITGSTRMKAGTATKLVLNTISTVSMIELGKVYQNLMVDLAGSCQKLRDRGIRIITTLTELPRERADQLLAAANGRVKVALVMHARSLERPAAEELLARHAGRLHRIL